MKSDLELSDTVLLGVTFKLTYCLNKNYVNVANYRPQSINPLLKSAQTCNVLLCSSYLRSWPNVCGCAICVEKNQYSKLNCVVL